MLFTRAMVGAQWQGLTLVKGLIGDGVGTTETLLKRRTLQVVGEIHSAARHPCSRLIIHPGSLLLGCVVPQEALLAVLIDARFPLAVGLVPDHAPIL